MSRARRRSGALYIEARVKAGSAEKAMVMVDGLRRFFADDTRSILAIAELASKHEAYEQSYALSDELLQRLAASLSRPDSARAERLRGDALIELGRPDQGIAALERALKPTRVIFRRWTASPRPTPHAAATIRRSKLSTESSSAVSATIAPRCCCRSATWPRRA